MVIPWNYYINTVFLYQKQTTNHLSFCDTKNTMAEDWHFLMIPFAKVLSYVNMTYSTKLCMVKEDLDMWVLETT